MLEVVLTSDKPLGAPTILAAVIITFTFLWYWASDERPYAGFPIVGKEKGEWINKKAKERFQMHATQILKQGMSLHKGPFQVIATHGPTIILPPSMTDEIRNDSRLVFNGASRKLFLGQYPGLEPLNFKGVQSDIFTATIRQNITQTLNSLTDSLTAETSSLLRTSLLPPSRITKDAWTPVHFARMAPTIAARLSAPVFLGEPLCHDETWLNISITYTVNVIAAVHRLRTWPPFLRALLHHFLPECRALRAQVAEARRIIEPQVAARRRARRDAAAAGKEPPAARDALAWMEAQGVKLAKNERAVDPVEGQLLLSFVAIHTTSLTLLAALYDLAEHPEMAEMVRKEIVEVLREEGGWKKTSLYKMKLLDSCLKESQRLHTLNAVLMNRQATEAVKLSDGTILPKGCIIGIPTYHMRDDENYENPDKFDGSRFLRMRQEPGMETRGQFVTTSADHIGFGHGQRACPGRFFASNEIKIALAYLLVNYEWKFEGGKPPARSLMDSEYVADPQQMILVKAREPELDLFKL
ncbi:putative cytochrome p450 protein [Lasiodiplodia theobromae]|uniref:Cytochrome P450 monooxygenase pyr3 n=1 Tax=Lasiodiplodia theobromae TaxID=45133 RepID=A0A5N5D7R1_9PEZI|nr:Cytochrome p450 protein [Lasiodiplodia theobromae]KAB2573778.1 Cytochrome P450 monooxygenase pyr3 [Lasiodiplodia theobromae]KAF4536477.1 Cytochrome p450 protein [Lasiodiplodia theobromae]KAF9630624.1 putative cytochrome p450 protein [Lasiodiplodia theobromae]